MKTKIVLAFLFAHLLAFAGVTTGPSSGVGSSFKIGTNVLVISQSGSDAAGAANPYKSEWKTAWDCTDTNGPVTTGAIKYAQPGDWVYFTPSATPYYVSAIPLNLMGPGSNGLNLIIPYGVTIIQTNFLASGATAANGGDQGAFIFPGNGSEVIVDGIVICTNTTIPSGSFDSIYGWLCSSGNPSAATQVGLTNYPPTTAYLHGFGYFYSYSDAILISQNNNTNIVSLVIDGPHIGYIPGGPCLITNGWDTFQFRGCTNTLNATVTFGPNCDFRAGNYYGVTANYASHAISALNCNLIFNGGYFEATGLTNGNNTAVPNGAISGLNCNIKVNGSTLVANGITNIVPIVYNTNFNLTPGLAQAQVGPNGSWITGAWREYGGQGGNTNGDWIMSGLVFNQPTNILDTNTIILSNSGIVGVNGVNGQYLYNSSTGAYTNTTSTSKFITNSVSGAGPFQIVSSGVIKGFSPTIQGWYTTTNSVTGSPIVLFTNTITSVRTRIY